MTTTPTYELITREDRAYRAACEAAWHRANNAGEGHIPNEDALAAAGVEDAEERRRLIESGDVSDAASWPYGDDELAVLLLDGKLTLIGWANGPWAVTVPADDDGWPVETATEDGEAEV